MPIVDFEPVPTNIPMVNPELFDEACNRRRAHELCAGLNVGREGILQKFIQNEYPVWSTLRWLTFFERMMGVYIRTLNPSANFKEMINFGSMAYLPAHLEIFLNPAYEDSSFHYLNYMRRSKVNF